MGFEYLGEGVVPGLGWSNWVGLEYLRVGGGGRVRLGTQRGVCFYAGGSCTTDRCSR